jgi:hypothetical protein
MLDFLPWKSILLVEENLKMPCLFVMGSSGSKKNVQMISVSSTSSRRLVSRNGNFNYRSVTDLIFQISSATDFSECSTTTV